MFLRESVKEGKKIIFDVRKLVKWKDKMECKWILDREWKGVGRFVFIEKGDNRK